MRWTGEWAGVPREELWELVNDSEKQHDMI